MQLTYQKLKPFALSYLTAPLAVFFAGYGKAHLSMPVSFSAVRAHTVKGQARRRGTKEEEFP